MCRLFRGCLSFTLLLIFNLSAAGKPGPNKAPDPGPTISLCVYNLAEISVEALDQAEEAAGRIFRRAGVEVVWLDYPLSQGKITNRPTCQPSFGEGDFRFRILPRFKAERLGVSRKALGLALPCAPGDGGCIVNVFYHRAEELAQQGDLEVPKVLGHAIAHKVGHVLLHASAHSPVGLMRAQWGPKELQQAGKGCLLFTQEQADVIREHVLANVKQVEPVSGSRISF